MPAHGDLIGPLSLAPLTSEIRTVCGGHPENMVVLRQVAGEEDVRDKEGGVRGQVAEGNVGVASLLQLVLREPVLCRQ